MTALPDTLGRDEVARQLHLSPRSLHRRRSRYAVSLPFYRAFVAWTACRHKTTGSTADAQ